MNEFAIILEFLAAGQAVVHGRGMELRPEEAALIRRVTCGEASDHERAAAVVLMRDREEALLLFVDLLAGGDEPDDDTADD